MATLTAMALAVWTLYAADRLLDSRGIGSGGAVELELESRHLFHHQYRRFFVTGIATSSATLAVLLPMLPGAAIHLYLTEGSFMAGYFLLIHIASRSYRREWLPKELLVGPFFAAAIFVPTVSRHPEMRLALLPMALMFAGLCSLNCLYIYAWEHPRMDGAAWATGYAVSKLRWFTVIFAAIASLLGLRLGAEQTRLALFPLACALSTSGLAAVHGARRHFAPVTLRALADFVLLTPLVALPFVGHM